MRKTRWVFLLALFPALLALSAQNVDNTQYVKDYLRQHPTWTIGQGVTAAQAACNADTSIPCIIVFDPSLAKYATGTMPAACSQCQWLDYRNGAPYIPTGGGSATALTASVNNVVNIMAPPYKAKGDCSTDDTAAITSAIAATPAGGTLFIPAAPGGCFKVTAAISVTAGINIEGSGWRANSWGMTFGEAGFLGHFSGSVVYSTVTSGTAFDINPSAAGLNYEKFAIVGPGSGTSVGIKWGDVSGSGYLNQATISNVFAGNFATPQSIFSQNSTYTAIKSLGCPASGTDPVGVGIYFDAQAGGTANANQLTGVVVAGGCHKDAFIQGQTNQLTTFDLENPAPNDATAVGLETYNCNECAFTSGYVETGAGQTFTGENILVTGPAGANNAIGSTFVNMHSSGATTNGMHVANAYHTTIVGSQIGGTLLIENAPTNVYTTDADAISNLTTTSNIFGEDGSWWGGNPHTIADPVTLNKGLTVKQMQGGTEYTTESHYIGAGFTGSVFGGTFEFAADPQCTTSASGNGCTVTIYHHFKYWNGSADTQANGVVQNWSLSPATGVPTSGTWRDQLPSFPAGMSSIRDVSAWGTYKLPANTLVNNTTVCLSNGTNCPAGSVVFKATFTSSTPITAGGFATVTVSLGRTMSDTTYAAACSPVNVSAVNPGALFITNVTKTTTTVAVTFATGTASQAVAMSIGEVDCVISN